MKNKTLTPLTNVQLIARKKKIVFYVATWLACAVAAGAFGYAYESKFSVLLSLCGLFTLWLPYINGAFSFKEDGALDGEGCLLLSGYANKHPEVKAYLCAVNQLDRAIVWYDLWTVNAWFVELHQEKMKKACLVINGVANA